MWLHVDVIGYGVIGFWSPWSEDAKNGPPGQSNSGESNSGESNSAAICSVSLFLFVYLVLVSLLNF